MKKLIITLAFLPALLFSQVNIKYINVPADTLEIRIPNGLADFRFWQGVLDASDAEIKCTQITVGDSTTSFIYSGPLPDIAKVAQMIRDSLDLLTLENVSRIDFNTNQTGYGQQNGRLSWDSTGSGTLIMYNEEADVALNLGEELWCPEWVLNNTASTITNGSLVYIDTTQGVYPTIMLADNRYYNKSRLLGVATHDIESYTKGKITTYGLAKDIPTMAGRESNIVYLGQNGNKVYTRPTGGAYPVIVGYAVTDTKLLVNISINEYPDELIKAFGLPNSSNSFTTLGFNNSTRYASIYPVGSDWYFYQNGTKYIMDADSIQMSNTEGLHYQYYSHDTLKTLSNPTHTQIEDIIKSKTLISIVYWDATNSKQIYFANERHTFHFDPYVHLWAHEAVSSAGINGMDISHITVDGSGAQDTAAQFNISTGHFYDEDIKHTTPEKVRGDNFPLYYLSGANGYPRRIYNDFPVLDDITAGVGATGRLVYNNVTTGTLVTATNNYYVLCHLFAINDLTDSNRVGAIIGQNQYSGAAAAQNGALVEAGNLAELFPENESVLLYTLIYETSNTFANGVKARIVSAVDALGNDVDYIDWRTQLSGGGGSGGSGDMLKSVYDKDNNGQVDIADSIDDANIQYKTATLDTLNSNPDTLSILTKYSNGTTEWVSIFPFINISLDTITSKTNSEIIVDSSITFNSGINVTYFSKSYASTVNIDFSTANKQYVDLTGNITINVTKASKGTSTLVVRQDATGRTITKGTGWGKVFPNSNTLGTTANYDYVIQFERVDAVDTADYHTIIEIQ